ALPDSVAAAIQQNMERYTKAKSLSAILAALDAVAPTQTPSVRAEPVVAPQPTVAVDYKTLLLTIVAERTGYPTDMLALDADLEADLGIDSIKRVEIVGALRKAVPDDVSAAIQQNMERYTKAKSLNAILAALDAIAPATTVTPAIVTQPASAPSVEVEIAATPRYVIKSRPAPLGDTKIALSGLAILLGDDDAIATGVCAQLRQRGLQPLLVGAADATALRTQIEQARSAHGPVRLLINLHGLRMQPVADLRGWQQAWQRDIVGLFHAIQIALADLPTARVIAASRNGGTFGRDAVGEGLPISGGANGILNCLRIEVPGCVARAVDFDGHSDEQVVRLLVDEIFADDQETEAGYIGSERYGAATLEQALAVSPFGSHLTPDGDWVLLATGGARGITAQIIERMVKPGMRLVLLGRTAEPADEPAATRGFADTAALRKGLLAERLARGERPRPVDIDREVSRIQVDRELRDNLKRLRAAGAVVDYRACDVRDEAAFGALIDDVYRQHGRIDAVIHGAGVIEDKLLADKQAESFERVLGTKLDPAFVLTQKLRPDRLKLIAFFTSVAGRYGNRGQSDYAAANETLNRLAWDLHRRWTQTRVMAVNWGPWDGGMASEGIKRQLRERGMEPIPLPSGCQFFLDELANGPRHDVELVAGQGPWGELAKAAAATAASAPVAAGSPRYAFARKPVRIGVGGAVTLDHKLTVAEDPWLRDHVVDGQPVVPLAIALETMAQFVASGWPEWTVAEIRDLRAHAPLLVDPETGVDIQLRAKAATHSEPGSQCISVQFGTPNRGDEPWFRATVVLMQQLPSGIAAQLAGLGELDPMTGAEAYAQHLCRGPRLRAVDRIGALAANGAVASVQASTPDRFIGRSATPWLFDPALLDAASQLAFVWAQRHQGKGVMPQRIGRLRRFGAQPVSGALTLVQHFVAGDNEQLTAAAEFVDASGALRYVVEDAESAINTALNRLAPSSPDYVDPAIGGQR
ncbi:MAG TPA: SDR family NAD(P)-dependent oxidoreductase, partial [Fontimonas sp.]